MRTFCLALLLPAAMLAAPYLVYFGTYTGPKSQGVYVAQFDPATGKLDAPKLAGEIRNPSWVTIHPNGRFLYAVTELGSDGKGEAALSSFAIDRPSGTLKKLNEVPSGGGGACHLAIDKKGRAIAVANYGTGSTAVFQLHPDGSIGTRTGFNQHQGSSANPRRQQGPHAHAVVLSGDNRFLFVPDLGLDQILSFRFDGAAGTIAPNDPPAAKVKPGSGPRHFVFHPKGKYAYAVNEMGSSVTVFAYDAAKGSLRELQTISTLPADFKGESNSAEIQVDRAGKFVYASNRGDDSITVFAAGTDGKLTVVQKVSSGGKTPRGFQLDPSGKFLLAGNQNTGNVAVFRIEKGKLTPTGQTIEVGAPVCVQFLK